MDKPTTDELLTLAFEVVSDNSLGMMATTNYLREPYARWMLAVPSKDLKTIYTLTGRRSRKLLQLCESSAVCWVFSALQRSDIVTLYGHARVVESLSVREVGLAWDRMLTAAKEYTGLGPLSDPTFEYCGIETTVQRCEVLFPRLDIKHSRVLFR
jgi:general stress protein 26